MKGVAIIFSKAAAMTLSVAVFVAAAWLWHRSLRMSDYLYRFEPLPAGRGSAMRGVASSKGALLVGAMYDRQPTDAPAHYQHEVHPVLIGGPSIVSARPTYKVAGLGFGVSRGELVVNVPLSFLLLPPPRTYEVVYIPYYFIMALAAIAPGRLMWRGIRRRAVGAHATPASYEGP
jgi:hypothetical protein